MGKAEASVFDDLERLRLTPEDLAGIAAANRERKTKAPKRRQPGAFIGGPFPLPQFLVAGSLPGKALLVWQLVHHQVRMTRKVEVTLPAELLAVARVDRNARARALRDLERAGFVQVRRQAGRMPRISLVTLPEDGPAGVA